MGERAFKALDEVIDAVTAKGSAVIKITVKHPDGSVTEMEARDGPAPEPTPGEITGAVERQRVLQEKLKAKRLV